MITDSQIPKSKSICTYHKKYGESNKCLIMVYKGTLYKHSTHMLVLSCCGCACVCVLSVGVTAGGKYNVSQHAKNSTSSWSWSSEVAYQKANVSFYFFFGFRDVLQFGEATQIERNVDTIFQCGFLFSFRAKSSTPEITTHFCWTTRCSTMGWDASLTCVEFA